MSEIDHPSRTHSSRIPSLLTPYLNDLNKYSLHLVTEIVGTSSTWLLMCYLTKFLSNTNTTSIIFISWAHPLHFWFREAKRLTTLDLKKYVDAERFFFVDNLDPVLSKGDPLKSTTDFISKALSDIPSTHDILLILDSPDLPLALSPSLTAATLQHTIMTWRQSVYATIVSLPADFIPPQENTHDAPDSLTLSQQQLLLGLAHQANVVMSTKSLDSGTAKDVSGVIRITCKGAIADKELLYLVDGGSVKGVDVWERGGLRA